MAKRRFGRTNDDSEESAMGAPKKISWSGLKKTLQIFRYTLPYKGYFIVGFIFLILSTGTSLAFPKLVGSIIEVIEGKSTYTINEITSFLVVILVFQAIFSFLRIYLFSRVSEWAMADVRRDVYSKIITLPIPFLEQRRRNSAAGCTIVYYRRVFSANRHAGGRYRAYFHYFLEAHALHARHVSGHGSISHGIWALHPPSF